MASHLSFNHFYFIMRILWTNHALDKPAGTETFTRDLTTSLAKQGHSIEIYTSIKGDIAADLETAGIPVHDNPQTFTGTFDIIHGQHHMETAIALASLPHTPAIFFCHAFPNNEWLETPFPHPRLLRIITTCSNLSIRMSQFLDSTEDIGVVFNPFNPDKFKTIRTPPQKPSRALFFHNTMTRERPEWSAAAEACKHLDITLDAVGAGFNNSHPSPEQLLPEYDLVFAGGRSAIEAAASGCGVLIFGLYGFSGLATINDAEALYATNFTKTTNLSPFNTDIIKQAILSYQPQPVQALTRLVRDKSSLHSVTKSLETEYNNLLKLPVPNQPDKESAALANGLHFASQHILKQNNQLNKLTTSNKKFLNQLQQELSNRKSAEEKLKTTAKVLQRGLFRKHAWHAVQRHWESIDQSPPSTQQD